jgi:putative sigma-54 modulation protein
MRQLCRRRRWQGGPAQGVWTDRKTSVGRNEEAQSCTRNRQERGTLMNITISGKNVEVTDALRNTINAKLGKLNRYFTDDTNIIVTLSVEKERQKIEVTIPVRGRIIRSEQVSNDMYISIDLVEEVIERQLRKYKNKIIDKKQNASNFQKAYIDNDYMENEDIRIVRTKKFPVKPMYPEDACVQMELLGHNFFVFTNADTDQVNVVYKRKGGTYGLIEPEE